LGLFDRHKNRKEESVFPLYTNTLNEKGVKIVLNYLSNKTKDIECVIDGDFSAYPYLSPQYKIIPDNIELAVHSKSDDLVRTWCKQLGQLLLDGGIKIQLRNSGNSLQIETQNTETKEWLPAVIIHGADSNR